MRCAACETVSFALLLGGEFMLVAGWTVRIVYVQPIRSRSTLVLRACPRGAHFRVTQLYFFFLFGVTER